MDRIINLEITFQSRVGRRARKDVVRKEAIDGPYRNRAIDIPMKLDTGPGSGANLLVRKTVTQALKTHRKIGELLFYVRAEFEHIEPHKRVSRYFKTIVPRTELPV